jgi:hypothetical protein
MPSGAITITPGKQLLPGELVNNAKLNAIGRPTGRLNAGSVTERELDADAVRAVLKLAGRNLFCNGGFTLAEAPAGLPLTGVISGGHNHDYGSANRWLTANDTHREADIFAFTAGQTSVPGSPTSFLKWTQSVALAVNPGYFGQRLEDVRRFDGQTLTLSLWVRADGAITVTPQARQYFGTGGGISAPVLVAGTSVVLVPATWTLITQTFDMPSLTGKTIDTDSSFTFTEFRLLMPQAVAFEIDFANCQVEVGETATIFEAKAPHEDILYARRYYEIAGIVLSNNITTHFPFINVMVPKAHGLTFGTNLSLIPASGTGATVAETNINGMPGLIVQDHNHSADLIVATVVMNTELYD